MPSASYVSATLMGGTQLGKTFGDYMREHGDKPPEEVKPADECAIEYWVTQEEIERENIGEPNPVQEAYEAAINQAEMLAVLGEEADYALCENCHVSVPVDNGVVCENCHLFFARHGKGRAGCWSNHNCGALVTSTGRLVHEGDILVYPSHADEFTVMKMEGTWVKGGHARGMRKRGSHEMPIIPRLMFHKETK